MAWPLKVREGTQVLRHHQGWLVSTRGASLEPRVASLHSHVEAPYLIVAGVDSSEEPPLLSQQTLAVGRGCPAAGQARNSGLVCTAGVGWSSRWSRVSVTMLGLQCQC